ncbi:MAG: hypothetical protein PF440_05395, partial [Thiomicrorhabdus sp.]|nr:hypothetical protein [Thiomicrorhabdus sp.]
MYETADKESSGDMMKGLQDLLTSQSDRAEKTSKSFVKEQKKTFSMMDSLLYHMEKPREIPQHGDIGNKKPSGTHVASIQDDAYDNLLLRMRVSVFKLSMVNAYDDIVEPLSLNMRINTLDVMDLMTRHQTENSMYYNAMVTGIGELKSDGEEKGRSVYLAMTSFFRNPAWTALHGATTAIGKFAGSSAWKALFGLGKKSSVEEDTLMAIRDQTEFQRTGEIAKKTGFIANLKQSGVIGASAKAIIGGVLNTEGMGSKNAQKVEDKKARGEQLGFWDKRALAFFDKSINKKAGIGSSTGSTVNRNRNDSDGKTVELLEDIKQELFLIHNGQREGLIIDGEVIKQNKTGINQAKKFNKSIVNIEDDSEKSAKFDKWSYKVLKKIKNQ